MGSGKRRTGRTASATAAGSRVARVAALTEEVQALRRALAETEQKLQASRAEATASGKSLRTAREERDRAADDLREASDAQTKAEQDLRKAMAERARIETALRMAEAARRDAETSKAQAEQALSNTRAALEQAQTGVAEPAGDEPGVGSERVAALEAQLELAGEQGARAASRIAELERNLEQARATTPDAPPAADDGVLDSLKRKARDYERRLRMAEAETVSAQRKVSELQQRLAEHSSQLTAIAQRNRRIHELRDDKASLEAKVGQLEEEVADRHLRCPRCGAKMIEIDHLGVTLDRCLACNGLYFDAGELEEVIEAEYPTAAEAVEPTDMIDPTSPDEDTLVDGPKGIGNGEQKPGFFRSLFKRKSQQMTAVSPDDVPES